MELVNFDQDIDTIHKHIEKHGISTVISALDRNPDRGDYDIRANIPTLIFVCENGICRDVCRMTGGDLKPVGEIETEINQKLSAGMLCKEVVAEDGYDKYIGKPFPTASRTHYLDFKASNIKRVCPEIPVLPSRRQEPTLECEREIGVGSGSVYLYTTDGDKGLGRVKIGHTVKDAKQRIICQFGTSNSGDPIWLLNIRTRNSAQLEAAIHDELNRRGSHIASRFGGTEWFLTTVEEIEKIYVMLNIDS